MPTSYNLADKNIRKTYVYMTGFFIFVIFVGFVFSQVFARSEILYIAFIFALVMNFVSYWYSDKIVLAMYRAKQIEKRDNPEVYRIVENLCLTAGLPIPKIYIIPENQPNAFATGRSPQNASIVFTQGILQILDKRELEGVAAHELSHVGNRDILISTVAVVLAGFVAMMADFFMRLSFWGFRGRDNKNQNPIMLIVGVAAAILAPIAATLIQLAISRNRELLADSSGVLLTRDPEGLATALEKISRSNIPMMMANHATNHLFISDPEKKQRGEGEESISWFAKIFMTHPPIQERIRLLREMEK